MAPHWPKPWTLSPRLLRLLQTVFVVNPKPRSLQGAFAEVCNLKKGFLARYILMRSISGVLGLAWIIGFAIYFRKRYKRKLRNEGKLPPLESKKVKEESQEKIVIPPDPAILFGRRAEEHYPRSERAEAPSATSLPPDKSPDGPSNESLNQYTSARPANSVNRNEE
ncbi:uncharacterized protein C8R40DRAFT_1069943 [Lentinula edodes]|uniref:uncharacterized protein n=1 Tax=Lentinula edodes TaxID=5353 RepID=UPI001E8DED81|nr:uncharacterized protein C8R40DRAFT_1069943 [Lentinula edodes]KAH7874564.1 hypothetical protein C8R40DRAFT_1069943 [Lentinula edodes]